MKEKFDYRVQDFSFERCKKSVPHVLLFSLAELRRREAAAPHLY
jgi:hypothetical protein